jgi:hypothetical protein
MEIQGYGTKLILQKTGESIFPVIVGENRQYRFRLPGKSLPAGTHVLEFCVGGYDGVGSTMGRLLITIEGGLRNAYQTAAILGEIPTVSQQKIDGVRYIVLFNPDTGTYYKISLAGFQENAQITLQEQS